MKELSDPDQVKEKINRCRDEIDNLFKRLMAEEFSVVGQQEVGLSKSGFFKGRNNSVSEGKPEILLNYFTKIIMYYMSLY